MDFLPQSICQVSGVPHLLELVWSFKDHQNPFHLDPAEQTKSFRGGKVYTTCTDPTRLPRHPLFLLENHCTRRQACRVCCWSWNARDPQPGSSTYDRGPRKPTGLSWSRKLPPNVNCPSLGCKLWTRLGCSAQGWIISTSFMERLLVIPWWHHWCGNVWLNPGLMTLQLKCSPLHRQ